MWYFLSLGKIKVISVHFNPLDLGTPELWENEALLKLLTLVSSGYRLSQYQEVRYFSSLKEL